MKTVNDPSMWSKVKLTPYCLKNIYIYIYIDSTSCHSVQAIAGKLRSGQCWSLLQKLEQSESVAAGLCSQIDQSARIQRSLAQKHQLYIHVVQEISLLSPSSIILVKV